MTIGRNINPQIERRKQIVQRWRALKLPRLFWKTQNWRWRNWPSGTIARTRDVFFYSLNDIETYLNGEPDKPTAPVARKGRG